MKGLDLGPIPYHESLTFVWLATGAHGESKAAYVLDGRDYADEEQARSAVHEALEQTDLRAQVAEFWPRGTSAESESELALHAAWATRLGPADLAALDEAVVFAARWHGDQTRPAGEPYLEHLLEATRVLVEAIGVTDVDILRAAVLHDVVEDTACTLDEVRDRFGERVAALVDWVTKPPRGEGQSKEDARTAYLTRLGDAPDDAMLVKLADRLSSVQRLDTHPRPEKRRDYYRETVRFIVPLAERHPWFRDWFGAWRAEFGHLDGTAGAARD